MLYTKVLGSNQFVHAFVGLLLALFVLISPFATNVVADIAPFLAVIFVFVILISVASKMLGGDMDAFPALRGIMLIFIVLIVIIGVGMKIRSQVDAAQQDTKDLSKTSNLIFHPTFLGMILIFAVAVFTIALLARGGH